MKKIYSIFLLAILASCQMKETNINPNRPTDVPLATLLPPAQRNLGNLIGREVFQYSNLLDNHMRGTNLQPEQISQYQIDEVFVGFMYSDFYVGVMHNLDLIIRTGDAEGSPHYAGIARVMMAYSLGVLTTFWGDIPYSEALDRTNLNPRFDPQQEIYSTLQNLLDQGIINLNEGQSNFSPGADDLLYNGNRGNWIKAAYALKARFTMHTLKRNPNAMSDADAALQQAFSQANQALVYRYQGSQTDLNPIYQYYLTNPNMEVHPDFRRMVRELNDPRIGVLFQRKPFTADTIPGLVLSDKDSPLPWISFEEVAFMRAEVSVRQGRTSDAQDALEEAVTENMKRLMGDNYSDSLAQEYLGRACVLTGNVAKDLEVVLTQKYIALFTHHEPFTDYRRTGFPELTPHPNGTNAQNPNGQVPRRLIYPQIERLNNSNFPVPNPDAQTRFWWDQ